MSLHEKQRFIARNVVIADLKLSHGAARLYMLLDDMANYRGTAWPSQKTVAKDFGVSVRSVQRWYQELRGRHLMTIRNRRETAIQSLAWTGALDTTKMSGTPTKLSPQHDKNVGSLPYCMNQEIEPRVFACGKCKDEGLIQEPGEFRIDAPTCDCERGLAILRRRVNPRKRA